MKYWKHLEEEKKRQQDLAFLDLLKTATPEQLLQIIKNNSHKKSPLWKKIAAERMLAKHKEH